MTTDFFFDSYAIIEVIKGNERYDSYLAAGVMMTKLNAFEMYYAFIRDNAQAVAETALELYYPLCIDFSEDTVRNAALLKKTYRKRKLSMTDCIGYVLAQKAGLKFLTGDKEFADLPGVEFVK